MTCNHPSCKPAADAPKYSSSSYSHVQVFLFALYLIKTAAGVW